MSTAWADECGTLLADVAACSCGWHAEVDHPATEVGEEAAEAQWNTEHLSPLIEAARTGWDSWPEELVGFMCATGCRPGTPPKLCAS